MINTLHILFPHSIYPFGITGGSLRTYNIARLARDTFESVAIFASDEHNLYNGEIDGLSVYQRNRYLNRLDQMKYYAEGLLSKKFSFRVPENAFDNKNSVLFQAEGPYFNNLMRKKNIKKFILDEHNVYWETHDFPSFNVTNNLYNFFSHKRDKDIEIQALRDATHILVCSERDRRLLMENVESLEDKITVIPNCIKFDEYEDYLRNYPIPRVLDGTFQIIFMGSLSYEPNIDAVNTICQDIAPHFENNVKFLIVGKNPPKIQKPENVSFLGYVEDIKGPVLQSDICIAPLRYGSGTRLKILEYWAMGKPVISTSKGAEGIEYTNGTDIIIEDSFDEFAGRIDDLLKNRNLREQLGKNGRELVRKKYDWAIYRKPLHDAYESCLT
jgi:glycosyltransferase involved in cell wall biosynthesis